MKQKPNDVDMMGSITTTYNNLSLGYGKLKNMPKHWKCKESIRNHQDTVSA